MIAILAVVIAIVVAFVLALVGLGFAAAALKAFSQASSYNNGETIILFVRDGASRPGSSGMPSGPLQV